MDPERFDALVHALTTPGSRRRVLRLVTGTLAVLGASRADDALEAAAKAARHRRQSTGTGKPSHGAKSAHGKRNSRHRSSASAAAPAPVCNPPCPVCTKCTQTGCKATTKDSACADACHACVNGLCQAKANGTRCAKGKTCQDGVCGGCATTCNPGQMLDANCNCVCTTSSCSSGCCNGTTCVSGANQSSTQCGTNGQTCQSCGPNELCANGACACATGFERCNSNCVASCTGGRVLDASCACVCSGTLRDCGAAGCRECCANTDCTAGQTCSSQGQCVSCTPNCTGKNCGAADDCGGLCITDQGCPFGVTCTTAGTCEGCPPGQLICSTDYCANGDCCTADGYQGLLCGGQCTSGVCCAAGGPCPDTSLGQCCGYDQAQCLNNVCCLKAGTPCGGPSDATCCNGCGIDNVHSGYTCL